MTDSIKTVKVWINAFIPKEVPGYSLKVKKGVHSGETMIPGPLPTSDCYLTDQRGFSNCVDAKSRMKSVVIVDFTKNKPKMTQSHKCDQTTELDCEDGDVEWTDYGNIGRMNCKLLDSSREDLAFISVKCAACNPCAPSSRIFGDIDYSGTIQIILPARTVTFKGKIDAFPAFEAYVSINGGPGKKLFQESPPIGNTVKDLVGHANRSINKRITF